MNKTYNPCDDCQYSYSKNSQEHPMCKICEFVYFRRELALKERELALKEGKWVKRVWIVFDSEKIGYICSECNTTCDTPTPHCPNCGAKMKGIN